MRRTAVRSLSLLSIPELVPICTIPRIAGGIILRKYMFMSFEKFGSLHRGERLFVLPNVWDARSAQIFEEKGFPAIATSSAAVAGSLGYEDGEGMPFEDYLFVIRRILASVRVPLSVDLEMGYGSSAAEVYGNILQLVRLGVVGINIEDSVICHPGRELKDAGVFSKTIGDIKKRLTGEGLELFINIRCDTYFLDVKNKERETRSRLAIYEDSGADGVFLPGISREEDISEAVNATKLPLNVMCIPGLPDFRVLNRLGVKRVSMGPFLFNKVYDVAGQLSQAVGTLESFSPILP
jgi:2-methylisocitrate lyase-like PEP mutase family enzyme